ncbi:hypothetical protein N665_0175s0037 [Sinapis alba]|nr:hypothetical protein N665_0175s0037 [Sinapis alba]
MSHHRSSCLASAPLLLLILSFLLSSFLDTAAGQIGVCYGRIGNNLPRSEDVVAFYGQRHIKLMRLYNPDQEVLTALKGSNIELLLDVPNSDIQRIASNQSEADTWVSNNVRNYANSVKFRYISVDNEVQPSDPEGIFLLAAMQNIELAVSDLGIKVSTAIDTRGLSGYPPSSGSFTPNFRVFIAPVIDFLVSKKSPLLVNIDTYFSYVKNMRDISLEYALLTPNNTVVNDGLNIYRNFFVALLDTLYAALEELSGGAVKIVVSETGWPTAGGTAASVYNARTYVNNLIQIVKTGSPKRPERATETYLLLDFDIKLVNNCSHTSGSRLDNRR